MLFAAFFTFILMLHAIDAAAVTAYAIISPRDAASAYAPAPAEARDAFSCVQR